MENDLIGYWKSNEGSFVIVDYKTDEGDSSAKGELVKVYPDGTVYIKNLKNDAISWRFNILKVEIINSKFFPIRKDGGFQ